MPVLTEYPKWVHAAGRTSVLVSDAGAEAAQLAEWGIGLPAPAVAAEVAPPVSAPSTSNLRDWDDDGRPGGSVPSDKPANALTAPAEPKRGGGWPKGKPRPAKRH